MPFGLAGFLRSCASETRTASGSANFPTVQKEYGQRYNTLSSKALPGMGGGNADTRLTPKASIIEHRSRRTLHARAPERALASMIIALVGAAHLLNSASARIASDIKL
jgi:hypothetical protein